MIGWQTQTSHNNRFINLQSAILSSSAFKKLSAKGIWVLLKFLEKRTWTTEGRGKSKKTIYENTGLVFPGGEAVRMGISESHFIEIIKRLIEVGFVDIEHHGGRHKRDYSRYCFSDRWKNYGTPAFIEAQKPKLLPPGEDVHSRKIKKAIRNHSQDATQNRSHYAINLKSGVRNPVAIEGKLE